MAKKRTRSSHWLNQQWWRFVVAEWIGLTLAFLSVVLIFCVFFIRRHTLEYHLEHTFTVRDPEFFGSALALSDPVPIAGNKLDLLLNGDEYFPAMLKAISAAQKTIILELTFFIRMRLGGSSAMPSASGQRQELRFVSSRRHRLRLGSGQLGRPDDESRGL
jgi:Phosphatidylserine/phosphatidylglycerophosphate/cardiolipin synthases and related enzymes